MSLGSAAVSPYIPRISALWRVVLPREGDVVKTRDANAWRLVLESRLGAVTSVRAFLNNCPDLLSVDAVKLVVRLLGTAVHIVHKCIFLNIFSLIGFCSLLLID